MHEIIIGERASRQLRHLPRDVLRSVNLAIENLGVDPRPRGCRKVRGEEHVWRVVVRGDYRVIYGVNDETKQVTVYDVKRREKNTYD